MPLRVIAELAGPRLIEPERNDRLIGLLIEAGLRVHEIIAFDNRRLLENQTGFLNALFFFDRLEDLVAERNTRHFGLLGRDRWMHLVEGQLGRAADKPLQVGDRLDPGSGRVVSLILWLFRGRTWVFTIISGRCRSFAADPGILHNDPVRALPNDRRLSCTQRVDAAVDSFNGGPDGVGDA